MSFSFFLRHFQEDDSFIDDIARLSIGIEWEASNETFLAGESRSPRYRIYWNGRALDIFALSFVRAKESRISGQSNLNRRGAHTRYSCAYPRGHARWFEIIVPCRTDNWTPTSLEFRMLSHEFHPRTYRWFAREEETEKIASALSRGKKISFHDLDQILDDKKKRKKKKSKKKNRMTINGETRFESFVRRDPQI